MLLSLRGGTSTEELRVMGIMLRRQIYMPRMPPE